MQKYILIYFIFVNIVAFVVYSFDKFRSRIGASRISEKNLHLLSILGGFLGASLSMALFRHKTNKTSFLLKHIFIMLVWIGAVVFYFDEINPLNFLR